METTNTTRSWLEEKLGQKTDHNHDYIIDLLDDFLKENLITELTKFICHPMKPGYRRHDVLERLKELKS